MSAWATLGALVAFTWCAPLLAAAFALRLSHPRTVSDLNCMAAGIFTGITFFHIIAESFEKVLPLFGDDKDGHDDEVRVLKLECALFVSGFVFMLWLDKLVFVRFHHAHSHPHRPPPRAAAVPVDSDCEELIGDASLAASEAQESTVVEVENAAPEEFSDVQKEEMDFQRNRVMANGLLGAFIVHSVIEGVAFGSETPQLDTILLFIVFAAHKGLDGLAVALPLSQVYPLQKYWLLVFIFSSATPLGLTVSFFVLQPGGVLEAFAGVVEAISGGVFMYIALFHILSEELEDASRMTRKVLIFTTSVLFMSVVEFVF
jgi:zinc transporter ZupT